MPQQFERSSLVQHLDLDRIQMLYVVIDDMIKKNMVDSDEVDYIYGAKDALMSILGEKNKLTAILGMDFDAHEDILKEDVFFLESYYKDVSVQ